MSSWAEVPISRYSKFCSLSFFNFLFRSPPQTPPPLLGELQTLSIYRTWQQTIARMSPETLVIQPEWILESPAFKSKCLLSILSSFSFQTCLYYSFIFSVMFMSEKDVNTAIFLTFNISFFFLNKDVPQDMWATWMWWPCLIHTMVPMFILEYDK